MQLGIENKTAIVTGASKGIGLAVAKSLANEGTRVLLVARGSDALKSASETIARSGGKVATLEGDVTDSDLASSAVSKCVELWGSVDILVNNAGGPPLGGFLEHDDCAWNSAVQTNLLSVVRFSKAVAPIMKERGWGRIISVGSTVSKEPSPAMVLSATVRAGVSSFTKAISIELAPFNVTANVICPGGVLTDRLESLIRSRSMHENRSYQELLNESRRMIPAGRFASANEISDVIAFLASERGSYITGVSVSVDGALTKSYL
jgi:3-oxoacyl-[acyl-carrier protein] reductase